MRRNACRVSISGAHCTKASSHAAHCLSVIAPYAGYQKLLAAGKIKKVALVACMRKLLVILNAMVKNNTPWRVVKAA